MNYFPTLASHSNPEPVFYTDDQQLLFMVTLPCHPALIVSKSGTKSSTKLSTEEVDAFFTDGFDFQSLSAILDNDISEVRDYVREYIGTKSGTKSGTKLIAIIDALDNGAKPRSTLLEGIGLYNKTGNFNNYLKPFIDSGIIELTIPDKPKSRFQEYRLTEKGKKLLKQ